METAPRHRLARVDYLLMTVLTVLSSALIFFSLHGGHNWGDDFSAYLSEGIALSEGKFAEQTVLNGAVIGSPEPVVYVWGYPLLLSLVHRLAGFDMVIFSSIIYYKIPSAVCLVVWGLVLYLFFRRRFGPPASFAAALLIACNPLVIGMANEIMTDMLFSCLAWISLYLMVTFLDGQKDPPHGPRVVTGVLLGVFIYLANITRYVGFVLLIVLGAAQTVQLIQSGRAARQRAQEAVSRKPEFRRLWVLMLPYLAFLALHLGVGLFMPYARTQASDVAKVTLDTALRNLDYYFYLIKRFVSSFVPLEVKLLTWLILSAALLGLITAFKKELPSALYMLATMAGLLLLPYIQGMRYMLNILPFLLLFFAYGVQRIIRWIAAGKKRLILCAGMLKYALMAAACTVLLAGSSAQAYHNMQNARTIPDGAYSQSAIGMYRYIRENIAPGSTVAFCRGRALTLNTGRLSYALFPDTISSLERADYLLLSSEPGAVVEFDLRKALLDKGQTIEHVHAAGTMQLYRLK